MNLLESLLDAIVRLEGDALVMHVGEKPYVVTTSASMNAYRGPLAWGQVELSSRVLTSDAVLQMLAQILPVEKRQALDELGAIEHEIYRTNGTSERFTIVAARGGDDVWLEVRRQPDMAPVLESPAAPASAGVDDFPSEAAEPSGHTSAPPVHDAARGDARGAEIAARADAIGPVDEHPAADASDRRADEPGREPAAEPDAARLPLPIAAAASEAQIEIVHEELQAFPTDDEVDAMLAATAAELLQGELPGSALIEIDDQDHAAAPEPATAESGDRDDSAAEQELVLDSLLTPPSFAAPPSEPEVNAAASGGPYPAAIEPTPEVLAARAPAVEETEPVVSRPAEPEAAIEMPQPATAPAAETERPAEPVAAARAPEAAESEPGSMPSIPEEHPPALARASESAPADASPLAEIVAGAFAAEAALAIARATSEHEPAFALTPPPEATESAPAESVADAIGSSVAAEGAEPLPFEAQPPDEPLPAVVEAAAAQPAAPQQAGMEEVVATGAPAERPSSLPPSVAAVPADAKEEADVPMPAFAEFAAPAAPGAAHAESKPESQTAEMTETHTDRPAPRAVFVETPRPTLVPPPSRAEAPPKVPAEGDGGITRILQSAAALGASIVYVVAQSRPMVRADGEIGTLEEEAVLAAEDVDAIAAHMDRVRGAAGDTAIDAAAEWMCDVPDVGRVRYLTFHDHRGPGIIFRMTPPRAISAEHLGLPSEVLALCAQPDGLVLVTGAHASGKSTMLTAFLDLINRSRSDHVISIESQIGFVHESRRSFVSQRELRGDSAAVAGAVRRALLEDPDVLFVEDLGSADLVAGVLEAAESGRLVFASVQAPSATAALEQIVELFPTERRAQARTALAGSLRGVVAQVLLRKVKGGRIAAREVLLNSPAVASLILEGKMFQLPSALEGGRRHGMVPLTDSLAGLVREGIVHVGEAYRKAVDRDALLAVLKREGVDTSFAERLA